jgi:2-amino-4-hydroxy-6-hydroxymethyldihydropteridine diphosphokinase
MAISFLSLGANQQDPIRMINLAIIDIGCLMNTAILKQSTIIKTPAYGVTQQQAFYNAVLKITTDLQPLDLLHKLQLIETKHGRVRKMPWGPRMIDIDILSYADLHLQHPKLSLPHPQVNTRPFIAFLLDQLTYT